MTTAIADAVARPSAPHTGPGREKSRLVWMDFARGLCILLVILVHARPAVNVYATVVEPAALDAFNLFFRPFRMAILMFLSGMLLHRSLGKPTGSYVSGKFTKIFWPFLIFSMVILLVSGNLTLINMLKVPISSPTLLWYLWFLVAFYMLALIFSRAGVPLWIVALLSLALVPVLPDFLRMPRFAFLFFFFLAGHLAMTLMIRGGPDANRLGPIRLGGWTAALGAVLAVAGGYVSMTQGGINYKPAYVWAPLGMALFMLSVAPLYRSSRATGWLEWIGSNSLVFYVIHFPVQILTAGVLVEFAGVHDPVVLIGSAVAAALMVSATVQVARTRSTRVAALFDFNLLRPSRVKLNPSQGAS